MQLQTNIDTLNYIVTSTIDVKKLSTSANTRPPIQCSCGLTIAYGSKPKHLKSEKHKRRVDQLLLTRKLETYESQENEGQEGEVRDEEVDEEAVKEVVEQEEEDAK
jgi:hypothetical protein